jgi:hypothetical protein
MLANWVITLEPRLEAAEHPRLTRHQEQFLSWNFDSQSGAVAVGTSTDTICD